tara:strand:- start:1238 stop:1450 length:213 start_codon:yes stop_codon:yes gene_type:complete
MRIPDANSGIRGWIFEFDGGALVGALPTRPLQHAKRLIRQFLLMKKFLAEDYAWNTRRENASGKAQAFWR